ncbi:MAG: PBSX family phage terminase large subunit [Lachnospiraceae bacterium]|nr:PBSX family phage terminase large subunit [Ruminococcus sp.]MCM1275602.1 PBSX family phage terminase large subunit [Lachnospiraceae bacterium]MCM1276269.1 PBSX family phage terminase large subunit [Lachnospiraceae bacterium]
MRFSPKQEEALRLLKNGRLRRINIFEGSVRSGKTHVSMILWAFWVAGSPRDRSYLMAAKTLSTLKRNVLEPLSEILGDGFTYSAAKKEGRLFGRRVYLEGAANALSENKIRGMTLMGAYCDELTLFDEEFFAMLLSRLSEDGAKLFATTNPDCPSHWVKRDYLDNGSLDLLSMKFGLEDNIFLPEKYVAELKKEFSGVFYDRYILGDWVAAEGRIYGDFSPACVLADGALKGRLSEKPLVRSVIGVDYGGSGSASAFVHVGFDEGFRNVYVLSEFYDKRNRSAECLINSFKEYVGRESERFPTLSAVYCDSAEQLLVKSFRAAVRTEVHNAKKKPINTRINMLNRLISSGRFFVSGECPRVIEAVQSAVWDERSPNKDVRLDNGTTNVDSLDAMEYAIERFEDLLFR